MNVTVDDRDLQHLATTVYAEGMVHGLNAAVDALYAALSAYQAAGATGIPLDVVRGVLDGISAVAATEEAALRVRR